MGKFSKALRHLDVDKIKRKRIEEAAALKLEEEKLEEEKRYITSAMDAVKYDWRSKTDLGASLREGMTSSGMISQTYGAEGEANLETIETTVATAFSDPTSSEFPGGLKNTSIAGNGTGSGQDGGFAVGNHLAFRGGPDSQPRWAVLNPIDSTTFDTLKITAIRGNDSNGGEDPDYSGEELTVWYYDTTASDWRALNVSPDGVTSGSNVIIPVGTDTADLRDWTIDIPDYARAKDMRFMLYQAWHSGAEWDHYGVTNVSYRRTAPLTVFTSLESPEASSFIRVAPVSEKRSSPKKRKKKIEQMLAASKKYTEIAIGKDFPGMGTKLDPSEASPVGKDQVAQAHRDAGTLSQQLKKALGKSGDAGSVDDQMDPPEVKTTDKIKQVVKTPSINVAKTTQKTLGNITADEQAALEKKIGKEEFTQIKSVGKTQLFKDTSIKDIQQIQSEIGVDNMKVLSTKTEEDFTKAVETVQTKPEFQKVVQDIEYASAISSVATAGKVYLNYLTNNLPDKIDNDYLGDGFVNRAFRDATINDKGTITVGDAVIGSGGKMSYNAETGKLVLPFNYDFDTNEQQIMKDPNKYDPRNGILTAAGMVSAWILGGKYGLDSVPIPGAGYATWLAKTLGTGGDHKPGEITIDPEQLATVNPNLYMQLIANDTLPLKNNRKSQSTSGIPDPRIGEKGTAQYAQTSKDYTNWEQGYLKTLRDAYEPLTKQQSELGTHAAYSWDKDHAAWLELQKEINNKILFHNKASEIVGNRKYHEFPEIGLPIPEWVQLNDNGFGWSWKPNVSKDIQGQNDQFVLLPFGTQRDSSGKETVIGGEHWWDKADLKAWQEANPEDAKTVDMTPIDPSQESPDKPGTEPVKTDEFGREYKAEHEMSDEVKERLRKQRVSANSIEKGAEQAPYMYNMPSEDVGVGEQKVVKIHGTDRTLYSAPAYTYWDGSGWTPSHLHTNHWQGHSPDGYFSSAMSYLYGRGPDGLVYPNLSYYGKKAAGSGRGYGIEPERFFKSRVEPYLNGKGVADQIAYYRNYGKTSWKFGYTDSEGKSKPGYYRPGETYFQEWMANNKKMREDLGFEEGKPLIPGKWVPPGWPDPDKEPDKYYDFMDKEPQLKDLIPPKWVPEGWPDPQKEPEKYYNYLEKEKAKEIKRIEDLIKERENETDPVKRFQNDLNSGKIEFNSEDYFTNAMDAFNLSDVMKSYWENPDKADKLSFSDFRNPDTNILPLYRIKGEDGKWIESADFEKNLLVADKLPDNIWQKRLSDETIELESLINKNVKGEDGKWTSPNRTFENYGNLAMKQMQMTSDWGNNDYWQDQARRSIDSQEYRLVTDGFLSPNVDSPLSGLKGYEQIQELMKDSSFKGLNAESKDLISGIAENWSDARNTFWGNRYGDTFEEAYDKAMQKVNRNLIDNWNTEKGIFTKLSTDKKSEVFDVFKTAMKNIDKTDTNKKASTILTALDMGMDTKDVAKLSTNWDKDLGINWYDSRKINAWVSDKDDPYGRWNKDLSEKEISSQVRDMLRSALQEKEVPHLSEKDIKSYQNETVNSLWKETPLGAFPQYMDGEKLKATDKLGTDETFNTNATISKFSNNAAIAMSIIKGEVVPHVPSKEEIKEFTNSFKVEDLYQMFLGDGKGGSFNRPVIPINFQEQRYADDNIYIDENGQFQNNQCPTCEGGVHVRQTTSNIKGSTDGKTSDHGVISGWGEGQVQVVVPPDGSEPYLKFTDYGSHNRKSTDPDEIPGNAFQKFVTNRISDAAHGLGWLNEKFDDIMGRQKEESAEVGNDIPDWMRKMGINGSTFTEFKVPLSELPPNMQELINSSPQSLEVRRYNKDLQVYAKDKLSDAGITPGEDSKPDPKDFEDDPRARNPFKFPDWAWSPDGSTYAQKATGYWGRGPETDASKVMWYQREDGSWSYWSAAPKGYAISFQHMPEGQGNPPSEHRMISSSWGILKPSSGGWGWWMDIANAASALNTYKGSWLEGLFDGIGDGIDWLLDHLLPGGDEDEDEADDDEEEEIPPDEEEDDEEEDDEEEEEDDDEEEEEDDDKEEEDEEGEDDQPDPKKEPQPDEQPDKSQPPVKDPIKAPTKTPEERRQERKHMLGDVEYKFDDNLTKPQQKKRIKKFQKQQLEKMTNKLKSDQQKVINDISNRFGQDKALDILTNSEVAMDTNKARDLIRRGQVPFLKPGQAKEILDTPGAAGELDFDTINILKRMMVDTRNYKGKEVEIAQLGSMEQKILRDGLRSKPTLRQQEKEQDRILKMYGLYIPLASEGGGGSNKWMPGKDVKIAYDPNQGTTANIKHQFGAGGEKGATEFDIRHQGTEILNIKKGEMQDPKNLDNVDSEIKTNLDKELKKFDISKNKSKMRVTHYEPQGELIKETTMKRIAKWNSKFQYKDKPAGTDDGFPDTPQVELDPKTQMHPRYGKHANRYKKLDPASANAMPKTGEPEIDAVVAKQKTKKKKKTFAEFKRA